MWGEVQLAEGDSPSRATYSRCNASLTSDLYRAAPNRDRTCWPQPGRRPIESGARPRITNLRGPGPYPSEPRALASATHPSSAHIIDCASHQVSTPARNPILAPYLSPKYNSRHATQCRRPPARDVAQCRRIGRLASNIRRTEIGQHRRPPPIHQLRRRVRLSDCRAHRRRREYSRGLGQSPACRCQVRPSLQLRPRRVWRE